MLTFLPLDEIEKMASWEGSQLNTAKEILAYELTSLVHGKEEAEKAQAAAKALFGGASDDSQIPTATLSADLFQNGSVDVITVLVSAGLSASRSEARRAIEQGGVTVNDEKITDIRATIPEESFDQGVLVRRGKKAYKKVVK